MACPAPVTTSTTAATGVAVTYTTPQAAGGQPPVTIACTPASGSTFPIGTTTVTCTATDAGNRTGSCTFPVTVSRIPTLTMTKFLAFGDSITAGEVSFPVSGAPSGGVSKMVIIPSASYPSVLLGLLRTRYTTQAGAITMTNAGLSGEKARSAEALLRFANLVANGRPDVVIIGHGYNDASDGTVLTATVQAIDNMMAEARNRRVGRVFVMNMAPGRPGGVNSLPLTSVQAFNERLERAVRGENAVLVDIYSAVLPNLNLYVGRDGLHPTEAGYSRIADTVFAAIRANLEVR
jgi:lysophospholipase L1-like esterase